VGKSAATRAEAEGGVLVATRCPRPCSGLPSSSRDLESCSLDVSTGGGARPASPHPLDARERSVGVLTQPLCCRYIDPMLGINAAELAILLAVVVATPLYFIVRLAVRSSK